MITESDSIDSEEELAEKYYSNPEDCFSFELPNANFSPFSRCYTYLITKKISANLILSDHSQNNRIASETQEKPKNIQDLDSSKSELYNKCPPEGHVDNFIFSHLVETKELPNTGVTVYKCEEHPDSPEYYDLKGIEESHFKPFHKDSNYPNKGF